MGQLKRFTIILTNFIFKTSAKSERKFSSSFNFSKTHARTQIKEFKMRIKSTKHSQNI